ncbi:hypothetical protein AB0P40_05060, partial [Streptomyces sp. NPDC079189]
MSTFDNATTDRPIGLTAPSGIDRAAHHRLDEAWLSAAWSHPTTRVFVVSGGQVLIDDKADGGTEIVMTPAFEAPVTETRTTARPCCSSAPTVTSPGRATGPT